jgi:hypothetical protein
MAPEGAARENTTEAVEAPRSVPSHQERPDDLAVPEEITGRVRETSPASLWVRGAFTSVQVNVDAAGNNIIGDAANEPSIAVDPTNPARIVIGWRQFDTIASNFRQSGWAYSHDTGLTWTFPGVLNPGEFASDPVLDYDAEGTFYYYSLQLERGPGEWACYLYKSTDGGMSWPFEVYAYGGDKAWFAIDRTGGMGHGNIYVSWNPYFGCCEPAFFNRSTDRGETFSTPIEIPETPGFGTLTVGPDGVLYVAGIRTDGIYDRVVVARSTTAQDALQPTVFDEVTLVDLGGTLSFDAGPNPDGLLGQVWIASDHSDGPTRGNLYLLASLDPIGDDDPLDVIFSRSTDGGLTWSDPVRVNDDSVGNGAWQWFGTMSVAPNGRIDAIWNDTRMLPSGLQSELYYSYSIDAGVTWSENVPLSPPYYHHDGYPSQEKLGDYYDMESDSFGVSIAYAATFNGEQDVYYLRIGATDCNGNGVPDVDDITGGGSEDCNANGVPDECEPDCNDNGVVDACDVTVGGADDCNSNLVPDECEPDLDGDGTIDGCDLDIDGDGIANDIDDCDYTTPGAPVDGHGRPISDTDSDCSVSLVDFGILADCTVIGGPGVALSRSCTTPFDYNGDRDVDLVDVAGVLNAFGGK